MACATRYSSTTSASQAINTQSPSSSRYSSLQVVARSVRRVDREITSIKRFSVSLESDSCTATGRDAPNTSSVTKPIVRRWCAKLVGCTGRRSISGQRFWGIRRGFVQTHERTLARAIHRHARLSLFRRYSIT